MKIEASIEVKIDQGDDQGGCVECFRPQRLDKTVKALCALETVHRGDRDRRESPNHTTGATTRLPQHTVTSARSLHGNARRSSFAHKDQTLGKDPPSRAFVCIEAQGWKSSSTHRHTHTPSSLLCCVLASVYLVGQTRQKKTKEKKTKEKKKRNESNLLGRSCFGGTDQNRRWQR
eukprot:TRINITY_DN1260_c0_g1_i2.p1 TRINITY_DN1260_c0_g1~~TRINITY_DN1260_c0_g1_i2.p1  ORF type:complete len:175 (+),score=25.04 TRINITY_DN1260_c0_g1_i2:298-822(+)